MPNRPDMHIAVVGICLLIGIPLAGRGLYCMFIKKIPPGWEHLGQVYQNIGESMSFSFAGIGLILFAVAQILGYPR